MRLAALVFLLLPIVAAADERILGFESDIVVGADGSIEVVETITVRAEGARIVRGIYRDFPTTYRDRFGNNLHVRYEPLGVMRNGQTENFFSENYSNGVRTYFGRSDYFLEPGVHKYQFRYRADRMLGFFEDHDELYWNATGLDWDFPIDRAVVTVLLEFDDRPLISGVDAYTGPMGASGTDYVAEIIGPGQARFEATRTLGPSEGLTIAVSWPKGHVSEPGGLQRTVWLFRDNVNLIVVVAGFITMFCYFIPVWRNFGKDPEEGLIVTRYEAPEGFSPASLRYIQQMYYDNKVMTAAVVNLAVKGYLRINEADDQHTLLRTDPGGDPAPLATGERELLDALFADGELIILDNEYHKLLGNARKSHRSSLKRDYAGRYFRTNGLLSFPGLVIAVVSSVVALKVGTGPTPLVIGVIVVMVVVFLAFAALMRRHTVLGRKVLDEVLGFRDYLEIAEKDEMNLRNPPEKTPRLFEKYLPFALAMGVEQAWSERFSDVFARLGGSGESSYQPSWYNGSWNSLDMSSNTSGLVSGLNSAISSSVTAPGSSSGSGGGGSSGGGGGGGGGGGW
jgi:uncharacterized membrane protein YgcG